VKCFVCFSLFFYGSLEFGLPGFLSFVTLLPELVTPLILTYSSLYLYRKFFIAGRLVYGLFALSLLRELFTRASPCFCLFSVFPL